MKNTRYKGVVAGRIIDRGHHTFFKECLNSYGCN